MRLIKIYIETAPNIYINLKNITRMALQAKKMSFLLQFISVKKFEKLILRNR